MRTKKRNKEKVRTDSKSWAQESHFVKRLKERYNIDITHQQYKLLCSYIRKGLPEYPDGTIVTFVDKQSNRSVAKILRVRWLCEQDLVVIYDKDRKTLVTCLPPEIDSADKIEWDKYY